QRDPPRLPEINAFEARANPGISGGNEIARDFDKRLLIPRSQVRSLPGPSRTPCKSRVYVVSCTNKAPRWQPKWQRTYVRVLERTVFTKIVGSIPAWPTQTGSG